VDHEPINLCEYWNASEWHVTYSSNCTAIIPCWLSTFHMKQNERYSSPSTLLVCNSSEFQIRRTGQLKKAIPVRVYSYSTKSLCTFVRLTRDPLGALGPGYRPTQTGVYPKNAGGGNISTAMRRMIQICVSGQRPLQFRRIRQCGRSFESNFLEDCRPLKKAERRDRDAYTLFAWFGVEDKITTIASEPKIFAG
jgi:hypothetical protein